MEGKRKKACKDLMTLNKYTAFPESPLVKAILYLVQKVLMLDVKGWLRENKLIPGKQYHTVEYEIV